MTQVVPTRPIALTALDPPPATPPTNRKASPCRSPSSQRSPTELSEALRDKDRRAQQQLERSGQQREHKMAAQRRKEQQRRLAAEDKRQRQQKAEKERLEALVRRRAGCGAERRGGGDAHDQLDNRPKRWTWGGPPDGVEGNTKSPPGHAIGSDVLPAASGTCQARNACELLAPPTPSDQPMSKQLSNSSAALHSLETASSNKHRPQRSSSNRRSIAALPEGTSRAKTPTGEVPAAPVRSSSFRANSKGSATPKRMRASRSRAQSPCSPGQYPPSPLRQRATTPVGDDRAHHGTLDRKSAKCAENSDKKMSKSTSRELCAESPGTPTGRSVGGTMDAEEASRLLAERRRLARMQKEQEERQRQEDELLRAEEERRRQQEARELQEREAQQAEVARARREEERKSREEEERRQKEQRWKDMQEELDQEREEAYQRAHREAERKRREREQLQIQEERERQLRKKRIEEIMKRTRKSDVEAPPDAAVYDASSEIAPLVLEENAPTPAEAPVILLGPLESKSCVDELSDGVQSMDVSPVSRDEPASAQEFSPVADGPDRCPLGNTMDVEPQAAPFAKLRAGSGMGDLNENLLIQAYGNTAAESSPLIHGVGPGRVDA
ncbi:MAP7 domain-containing protein 2 isoform X2 [Syngnathus scovelli]|uniref:MAP7 domain-containing protein 2 isoform X2 n=1 Tax=Syngnathus scovelli TaxID=161590 RepID=UPI00211033DC|nr:MAP7 domain-containing protein 2 isoform X2 [Syngnathus scovelli]